MAFDIGAFEYVAPTATKKVATLPKEFTHSGSVKPTYPVVVDWSNPLSKYLRYVFIDTRPSLLTGDSVTVDSDVVMSSGNIYFPGNVGDSIKLDNDPAWSNESYTIISKAHFESGGGLYPAIWGKGDTGTGEGMLRTNSTGTTLDWYVGTVNAAGITFNSGSTYACVYNHSGAINADRYKLYENGIDQNIAGTAAYPLSSTKAFEIGNADSGVATNRAWRGSIEYVFVFNTNLSEAEIKLLHEQPYSILKPAQDLVYYTGSAAPPGDINIAFTTSTESLTLSEVNVAVDNNCTVNASTESFSLVETNATVDNNATVLASTESLTVSEVSSVIDNNNTVNTITESLTLVEQQAVVDNNYTITTTTTSLSVTTSTAVISVVSASGVLGDGVLGSAVLAATESGDLGIVVDASTASLALSEVDALVSNNTEVLTITESFTLTEIASNVSNNLEIAATTASLSLTEYDATFSNLTLTEADILAIADAVYAKLVAEGLVTQVEEVHQLMGLNASKPVTTTQTSTTSSTNIDMTITGDGVTTSTITRNP